MDPENLVRSWFSLLGLSVVARRLSASLDRSWFSAGFIPLICFRAVGKRIASGFFSAAPRLMLSLPSRITRQSHSGPSFLNDSGDPIGLISVPENPALLLLT